MSASTKSSRLVRWIVASAVVLALALPAAVVGILMSGVAAQHARIDRIKKMRAYIQLLNTDAAESEPMEFFRSAFQIQPVELVGFVPPAGDDFDELVANVAALHVVKEIYFDGSPLNDQQLRLLSRLRATERLDLDGTDVTDAGLVHLAQFEKLKTLSLLATPITDQGIDAIGRVKSLREVDLCETAVTDAGAQRLRQLLPGATIKVHPAPSQKHNQTLRELLRRGAESNGRFLIVSGILGGEENWSNFDWTRLTDIQGLEMLSVHGIHADRQLLQQIVATSSLKTLSIDCRIEDARQVQLVERLPLLETLHFEHVALDEELLMRLVSLPKLKSLAVCKCNFDNAIWGRVPIPDRLESIDLYFTNLNDEGMQAIAAWKTLKRLVIPETEVSDDSVEAILSLPHLEMAFVKDSAVSAAGEAKIDEALAARAVKGIDVTLP